MGNYKSFNKRNIINKVRGRINKKILFIGTLKAPKF